jgi:pepF/M3 family oligoendopeptidase
MTDDSRLPRWDLAPILPSVEEASFGEVLHRVQKEVSALVALFDRHGIGSQTQEDSPKTDPFEEVVRAYLDVRTRAYLIEAYLECLTAADSRDNAAQASLSELLPTLATLNLLLTRLTSWAGRLEADALIASSPLARDHAFFLRKSQVRAQHLMGPAEEALAADLLLTGSTAWERMHATLTSQLMVPIEDEGEIQQLPMSAIRNLAQDPDRALRQRAYDAEVAAWHQVRVPLAAAMNSIKGEVNLLSRRRGWSSPLEATLFEHAIDRPILVAMMEAAEESFDDFRRYLKAKARRMGLTSLAWYDMNAPVSEASEGWTYPQACDFILDHFRRFSPALEDTARRAFDEGWVDAEPREGKAGGAFCEWMRGVESRILTNFLPTYDGMSILAHELGHAYHNRARATRTIIQRRTPSTLAETASIFCETLVAQAAYEESDDSQRLAILESFLQTACAVVVDIAGRFYFEQSVFERRGLRDLSPDELCEEMRRAQARSYGDGIDSRTYHPYMWAVKPHYYSGTASFYNYPYTFGLLFGLGLYSVYRERPDRFVSEYEDLLSRTGMATAAELAEDFGIDLRAPSFWRASLDIVRERIARFEALARTDQSTS